MARHRPAAEGGYQRGEETRARIMCAAVKLFGQHGFDGASTRDIAREAGVNAPALQYYFDSKEGVYLACIESIIGHAWEFLGEAVEGAEAVLADPGAGDAALKRAYLAIQSLFISFTRETEDKNHLRLFMARERAGLGPPSAFERLDEGLNQRLFGVTAALIGRLLGRPADDQITRIRAIAIDNQSLAFRAMRRYALSELGWASFGAEETETLRAVLLAQTQDLLDGLVRSRKAADKAAETDAPSPPIPLKRGR